MGPNFCAEKEVDSLGEMEEEEVDRPSPECCIGDDDLPLHHNIQDTRGAQVVFCRLDLVP